jgi:hypothetical protein
MTEGHQGEAIFGVVEIPLAQSLVEINRNKDEITNNTTMDVIVTSAIEGEDFRFSSFLATDDSVLDSASHATFPRNSSGLTKKIIGDLIGQETEELRERNKGRSDLITFRSRVRIRIGIGLGFLMGGSFALTAMDAVENGVTDKTLVGGALTAMIGGLAVICGGSIQDELTKPLSDNGINNSVRRLTLLEVVSRASDRNDIKNK